MSNFINTPEYSARHKKSFVIEAGGILLEVDEFKVGAEFRDQFSKGEIKKINEHSFITKWDEGFEIEYPLPYEVCKIKHLSLSEEDMYFYGFKEKRKNEQISFFMQKG